MRKIKLKTRTKVILIIVILLFLAIIIENLINHLSNVTSEIQTQKEVEKKQEAYMQTPEFREEKRIESSINQATEYIKTNDYEKLYEHMDPDFKDYMGIDSVEEFIPIVDEYVGGAQNIRLVDYGGVNNKYTCDISVQYDDVTENKKLIITPLPNDDFYIMFDEIDGFMKFNGDFVGITGELKCELKYKVTQKQENIYTFAIENLTDKDIVGSLENSYIVRSNYKNFKPNNVDELKNIIIPAKGTKEIKFRCAIKNENEYAFPDDSFVMKINGSNGINYSLNVQLEKNYWE